MKIKELRESSVEELSARRRELKQEALNLRISQQSGQLENPARITLIRKEIARIETIITERSRAAVVKKAA
ncbi:MAG: 50S ribosomal protein L29 [Verrucomicrobiaceae bacterium]|jgi:large subunit ribosomal protein L29|nr:50S ribosomal protein L29 [Verrucomicrobiaceae bacterium]